jgi:RecA-family ATPase
MEARRAQLISALDLISSDSLESIGIDELLGKDIEVEWLVEPLIPLNSVTVICGDSRLGKSWLALSLCHAVANSFPLWLGKYRIQRNGGALYLDNELGDAGMRARLLQFDLGSGIQTIVPVASEAEDPWAEETEESPGEPAEGRPLRLLFDPRVHTGQIGGLERLVRKVKARVVVLDPFADFIPPWTKLRDNDDMYREIQRLRRFAQRVHCAIIIVHHRRKFQPGMDAADHGSSVLGAQAILSRPDSCIMLLGQSDGPRIVNHDKARFSETVERSFYLEKVAGPDGRGVVLLHGGPVGGDESEKSELAAEVALAHLQVGQVRQFELVKAMVSEAKCGSRTAREVLLHMCADNRIVKIALGGRQVAYELPSAL